ncbi:uncharacterized protein LOC111700201 [Eurytemora carolleeae]|uniref:uncharacterized protein LOC111700201 n=1 Tax=Eurytemora carolleeae TaxID=1294199 RepID=UPI000C765203|nr:uncharacterized protein LOC111700201 [Eurytemora carolleeae]|eukprot:XP_023326825.1 uncharacterized protein LOC111700201 [Eurytemora affinis]
MLAHFTVFGALLHSSLSIFIIPQVPTVLFTQSYPLPQVYLDTGSVLAPNSGPVATPVRSEEPKEPKDDLLPEKFTGRLASRTLDLCYFLGNDIQSSHVACNKNWADGSAEGVRKYVNEMTFETNRMIGESNLKLVWKGPFSRHDATQRYPTNPAADVLSVANSGCDAVVFLVFNTFSKDCKTAVYGHTYGGFSQGGMCEANIGKGYTIVVDQGFMNDVWTGPQILAHHLLKMLVDDIKGEKTCPNQDSLLFAQLYPGVQKVDQCVVEKLNQSNVSQRPCMQN